VELTGLGPEQFVHVGDEIETDVLGAQAFGMRAVWLNRSGAEVPEAVHPDAVISSLEPLPELVDRLLA
jgi:FMN hydrolase / 5-amino-6-(5-phospho-D-ribitylamino)uracil phosphatase